MRKTTLYWYDYETFGTHPATDRPAQFAGIRTDTELRNIGDELLIYCQPSDDTLPDPLACTVTGIGPMQAFERGLPEYRFIESIREQLGKPGTCNVGYNNIRFDDEFTRYTLFRNFRDAYRHEYADGNSRWDLLDIVRLTRALRPDGINWPFHEDGTPSNRLEDLTRVNDIEHVGAHDALADVRATIDLARLIRQAQPRLFSFAFNHRLKFEVMKLLNWQHQQPVVHVSGRLPGKYLHTALVVPICQHPVNRNEIIVYDLRESPAVIADLTAEQITARLYTPRKDLPPDTAPIPIKTIRLNRAPIVAPISVLDQEAAERCRIDLSQSLQHCKIVQSMPDLAAKLSSAMRNRPPMSEQHNTDSTLYGSGFFSPGDQRLCQTIAASNPEQLAALAADGLPMADDKRLPEMLFRYRARNFPDSLASEEWQRWQEHCRAVYGEVRDDTSRLQQITEILEHWPEGHPLGTDIRAWLQHLDQRIGLPKLAKPA